MIFLEIKILARNPYPLPDRPSHAACNNLIIHEKLLEIRYEYILREIQDKKEHIQRNM